MNIFIPANIFLLTAISLIAFDNKAPLQNLQDENNNSNYRTPPKTPKPQNPKTPNG